MATVSPFQDYELTKSLFDLEQLFYETKREYDSLKTSLEHKEKRLKAIEEKMKDIVENSEEWELNRDNYLSYNGNYSVQNFVEASLCTRNEKKVIETIVDTLKLKERDSRYTKKYWEDRLANGTYSIEK